jgi:hypothetical protein
MRNTLYRLDVYENNMGTLIGFYDSLDEIEYNLVPSDVKDGNFVQVTEFTTNDDVVGLSAWKEGDIVDTYYFEYTEF